jgi:hypothetical protein
MSAIARQPDESREQFIQRVIDQAQPLSPDQVAELAPLLRLGAERGDVDD